MKFATARGNARIAYDVLGAGAPIVMLHDFGKSSRFWCDIGCVKTCLGQGRQAVMIDLPGHGESSTPNGRVKFGSIDCIEEVIAVLDHAGIARADFLGYGLGGRIALCVAARAGAATPVPQDQIRFLKISQYARRFSTMWSTEFTIVTAAPPAHVWRLLSDVDCWPRWNGAVGHVDSVRETFFAHSANSSLGAAAGATGFRQGDQTF